MAVTKPSPWRLAVATVALSACTVAAETPPDTIPVAATTTSATSTTAPTASSTTTPPSPAPSTTSTTSRPPTLGLVTPTGIPVAVIGEQGRGYLVVSPCGNPVTVDAGRPLGPTTVILDPGHGGPMDSGAIGHNGLTEKQLNLDVAERAAEALGDRGIGVVLTRTDDYASPLAVRAHLADTLRADVMVSIHHNAPSQARADEPGVEIFVQSGSARSARLGGLLWDHTRPALSGFDVQWVAAADAGVMTVLNTRGTDAYGILRRPETPTALIELGYLSNPSEAELYARPVYAEVAGLAIAIAIEAYLLTERVGSGLVDGRVFNPSPGLGRDRCVDPDLSLWQLDARGPTTFPE